MNNDTVVQGTIEAPNEIRWYAFGLDKKSTVTILLNSVEMLDAEVMLLIDPETGKLIDIFEFNFFYHHNPSPGNKILTTGPYKTEQLKQWE